MRMFRKFLALPALTLLFLWMLTACGESQEMTILFPKIGAADSALILTEDATILIDTGESDDSTEILSLLSQYGRDTVDLLVISHYDKDHVGGAADIIETVTVKQVIGSLCPKDSEECTAYWKALAKSGLQEEIPEAGSTTEITFGKLNLIIHAPGSGYQEDESNNASNIVEVFFGDTALLFTGDALAERLDEFNWRNAAYDLIKIPHHGRDADTVASYLPSFKEGASAVITSSKKNPESEALLNTLHQAGISTFLTRDGNITVVSDGNTLQIS